jgi:hypothetical protein
MKAVEEHKAAAESVFSEGPRDTSQRRARVRAGGPARRRAAGREQDSSEGEEVCGRLHMSPAYQHSAHVTCQQYVGFAASILRIYNTTGLGIPRSGGGKHARSKGWHGNVQESSEAAYSSSEEESDQESSAPAAPVLTESNADTSARSPALKSRLGRGRTRGAARQAENMQPA